MLSVRRAFDFRASWMAQVEQGYSFYLGKDAGGHSGAFLVHT